MDASYSFGHDQRPHKGDPSSLLFKPHTRWWLNNSGVRGIGNSIDKVQVSEYEVKLSEDSKVSIENQVIEEYFSSCPKSNAAFHLDVAAEHCCSHCKNNEDSWSQKFESKTNDDLLQNAHMMEELDSSNHLLFERPKKHSSELNSQWTELKKMEPWWQAADRDDLASLGSQAQAYEISTLGFQVVQSMLVEKISVDPANSYDQFNAQIADKKTSVLTAVDYKEHFTSVSVHKSLAKLGLMELIKQESDGNLSFSTGDISNEAKGGSSDTEDLMGSDLLSRTELVEALCRSQMRARKAEKLAQEACDEKDHVINILFQQASRLFAYKLWLQLLHLETVCLHLRNKDSHSSFTLPSMCRGGTSRETRRRRIQRKPAGKESCRICNCAVAVALGLSLAGTGLLVGWTIGWLFPVL